MCLPIRGDKGVLEAPRLHPARVRLGALEGAGGGGVTDVLHVPRQHGVLWRFIIFIYNLYIHILNTGLGYFRTSL